MDMQLRCATEAKGDVSFVQLLELPGRRSAHGPELPESGAFVPLRSGGKTEGPSGACAI